MSLGLLAVARLCAFGLAFGALRANASEFQLYDEQEAAPAAVAPFVLQANDQARDRAVNCLAEAVYYEAGGEVLEGQEAVAQVVLNRLMHPGFPKSVCGVVFEGSARRTGCQFTFTCDGSLARRPDALRWEAARQVALAALDGHVAADVGASTHYHAVWMTPYWSASLVRTRRIGGHVFYRLPGVNGSPAALTGQYSGDETAAPVIPTEYETGKDTGAGQYGRRASLARGNGVSQFSVWGLQVATISASHGGIVVRDGS